MFWYIAIIVLIYLLYCNRTIVYRFYSPNCGYCRSSQDEWELFKINGYTNLIFNKEINLDDCSDEDRQLADKLQVKAMPTICMVMPDGSANIYLGDRTAKSILSWAKMS